MVIPIDPLDLIHRTVGREFLYTLPDLVWKLSPQLSEALVRSGVQRLVDYGSLGFDTKMKLYQREGPNTPAPLVPPYLYGIVRKDFTSGALLSQFGHSITECLSREDLPLPDNTRLVILGATKEQLAVVREKLIAANIKHKAILETDGPLAGVVTAIGLLTYAREQLQPITGELKPFRDPK